MTACVRALVSLACIFASGCAASDASRVKGLAYNASYATVWKAVSEEMHRRYKDQIKLEDPAKGHILSDWKEVDTTRESVAGDVNSRAAVVGSLVMRMVVRIDGPAPWTVVVDGEAAHYAPGMSVLTPYKHGAIDEPGWVEARIDRLYVDIHDRLKPYAVKVARAR